MNLLLCGDFAVHTGFARVNEALAAQLAARGWDISVLAINYKGMPHALQRQYRLYPALIGGDSHGAGLLAGVVERERPDAILLVNDPWIVARHLLAALPPDAPPAVAYMPVDAPGINPAYLAGINRLAHAVAYTDFGLAELRLAGLAAPASVIPHGVDLELFRPVPRAEARARGGLDPAAFVVLVADQNQARKRLDIAFEAFARFARDVPEAHLIYHGSTNPTWGYDVGDLAEQLGVADRFAVTGDFPTFLSGVVEDDLRSIYSLADVKLSTSAGEGWGLTTMEAMACGVPCAAADYAALGEWAQGAACLLPVEATVTHTGGINTRGAALDPQQAARALLELHASPWLRATVAARGLERVREPQYRWEAIGAQFDAVLRAVAGAGAGKAVAA